MVWTRTLTDSTQWGGPSGPGTRARKRASGPPHLSPRVLNKPAYEEFSTMLANMAGTRTGFLLLISVLCYAARAQTPAGADAIQRFLKDGDAAYARGDYAAAGQSFGKALQNARRLPAKAPQRYEILKRLTSTLTASGHFAEAGDDLQQAIQWREANAGRNDSKILNDLLLSINLDVRAGNFDRALATAQRVQAHHIATGTADSLPVADDDLRIGQIHLAAGNAKQAARAFSGAYALRTKLAGSLDPGLLPILDGLTEAFRAAANGSGTGSDGLYRQALTIREMLYGADSTELIATIEGLADTYTGEGEYDAAEPLYQRLLALWENLGKDHPMVAVTLDKLVLFYARQGKTDKAREALQQSVSIRERFLAVGLFQQAAGSTGESHPEEARTLYVRALAALDLSDPANRDLIQLLRKAIDDLPSPAAK